MTVITATDYSRAIAGAVRAEFAKRRIDKKDLAGVLGCSLPTAYGRINGRLDWPARDIEAVSTFLDMSPQRLNELASDVSYRTDTVEPTLPVDLYAQPARAKRKAGQ
jgi:hypothetical protein